MEEAWNFFEDILPPEVTLHVFTHFSLEDIVYVSLVCKTWNTYFDTKQIWKQIYDLNFGPVNEKSVDLSQNMRWKRLFFKASSGRNWSTEFLNAATTFTCQYSGSWSANDWLSPNGRYHAVEFGGMIAMTDIKMAAKIIPVKQNLVSLHSAKTFNLGWENDFKRSVAKYHDMKPPKDDLFVMGDPLRYDGRTHFFATNGRGDFLFKSSQGDRFVLFNIEEHAINGKTSTALSIKQRKIEQYEYISFNSRFAVFVLPGKVDIIDLTPKRCTHCCDIRPKNGFYVPDKLTCDDSNKCAIIETFEGPFVIGFASQFNPNKIIFCSAFKNLSIWTHGEGLKELNIVTSFYIFNPSEHVVNINGVNRHWFTVGSGDKRYFIDLNDTTKRSVTPGTEIEKWVPKKSKIALAVKNKVTVYDVERNAWCAKLNFDEQVSAMAFTKSGNVLFVATKSDIFVYLWETALLITSIPHGVAETITRIHFAMDQVLIIGTRQMSCYKKIKIKLDI